MSCCVSGAASVSSCASSTLSVAKMIKEGSNMADKVTNILLAGVGGQGILLASEVLSEVMMLAGYDVKKNEIHGMSQRGGSVVSHVRFGKEVFSPIIPEGEADVLDRK